MLKIITNSSKETAEVGLRLGCILNKGDVVCLTGGLGTGKTAFTGGIAAALGIKGYITSPTFTIVNEYEGKMPLFHFDVYRINDSDEMFEIGFDEYIEGNGIVVIEWADLIKDVLPRSYISIDIKKDLNIGEDVRVIIIEFIGEKYKQLEGRFETCENTGC